MNHKCTEKERKRDRVRHVEAEEDRVSHTEAKNDRREQHREWERDFHALTSSSSTNK